jgi:uncharacterized Fe-S cluster-containing radical SAM superfamily protein
MVEMDLASNLGTGTVTHSIDTPRFSEQLRRRGIDIEQGKILVSNFENSEEAKDFTLPSNCGGFGRIHHFRRFQPRPFLDNPLPIDAASKYLGLGRVDELRAQVFQNAICSWRCWYCFVDFDLLSANPRFSAYKSADELIDLYLSEPNRPNVIDLSGGQPDLVPEWGLWFAQALLRRNLQRSVYLWTDDNLSNDYLWRFLTTKEIEQLASFPNYGRVGCFKGFDPESFAFNTKAEPRLFDEQFKLMHRLVESGFDVYGYATFTTPTETNIPSKMSTFVDRLQEEVHPIFPLRTIPLRISIFTPTASRLGLDQDRALKLQEIAVTAWNDELSRRFPIALRKKNITTHLLN